MPHVKYDSENKVVAVSEVPLPEFVEVAEDDEGLGQFLDKTSGRDALGQTDIGFIRVVEDVIELLMDKNLILFTELPAPAQKKMLQRQHLREKLQNSLDLLGEDDAF